MPSVLVGFLRRHATMIPSATSRHGGPSTHRFKKLEKCDRRVFLQDLVSSMDVSTAFDISFPEFPASCFNLKQPFGNRGQFSGSMTPEDVVTELGNALTGILQLQDVHEQSGQIFLADTDNLSLLEKDVPSEEFKVDQTKHLNAPSILYKCATFPSFRKTSPCLVSMNKSNEILDGSPSIANFSDPVCTPSISLPTPLKLVSALKGGREKQGIPLKKMSVTWAPDVYEPPTTSLSHTVKSRNQHRSRNSKKNSKHKHKGKSSRGSTSERQYRRHASSSSSRPKSLSTCDKMLPDGYNRSNMELPELVVSGQDFNCGSSLYGTERL